MITCRIASGYARCLQSGKKHRSLKAMEDASAWNSNAEACSQSAGMTIKYGIDALEMGGVSPGDKMLDVASGPGHLAAYAASEKGATVDAIDFASENIATLQRNLQSNPVAVTGHVMDGQQLEFQDDLFDVSCSCFGVFLFPDYVKGLSEMFRVTKPGGRAVVVSWAEPHRAAMQVWARLFDQQFPEVLPLPLPAGIEKMSTMEGAKEVLAAAGFENVKVSEVVHTWEVPDPTAFTNMFMQNPLMQLVRARLNTERFAELVPRVLELLESDYKKGDRISFDAVGIIACGTKPMP